jgi:AraC family L-rhamnose operon transcriptional activator RhaR/AraC family L-rhamnose operon regulatory protein RhaS
MSPVNLKKPPALPFRTEYRDPQKAFPLHIHDFYQISMVYSGRGTCLVDRNHYEIQGGDVVIIRPGQVHGFKNNRDLILRDLQIKAAFLEDDTFGISSMPGYRSIFTRDSSSGGEGPAVCFRLDIPVFLEIQNSVELIIREIGEKYPGYEIGARLALTQILFNMLRHCQEPGDGGDLRARPEILAALNYIKENYQRPLSIQELIGISGFSASRFLRAFKRCTGCSPLEYLNRLRVSAAGRDMLTSAKSITAIALDTGFNDSNYFSRCFKKYTGLSPRQYRETSLI